MPLRKHKPKLVKGDRLKSMKGPPSAEVRAMLSSTSEWPECQWCGLRLGPHYCDEFRRFRAKIRNGCWATPVQHIPGMPCTSTCAVMDLPDSERTSAALDRRARILGAEARAAGVERVANPFVLTPHGVFAFNWSKGWEDGLR